MPARARRPLRTAPAYGRPNPSLSAVGRSESCADTRPADRDRPLRAEDPFDVLPRTTRAIAPFPCRITSLSPPYPPLRSTTAPRGRRRGGARPGRPNIPTHKGRALHATKRRPDRATPLTGNLSLPPAPPRRARAPDAPNSGAQGTPPRCDDVVKGRLCLSEPCRATRRVPRCARGRMCLRTHGCPHNAPASGRVLGVGGRRGAGVEGARRGGLGARPPLGGLAGARARPPRVASRLEGSP